MRYVKLCKNSTSLCAQLGFNDFSVWRTVKSEHIFPLYTCPILARQPHGLRLESGRFGMPKKHWNKTAKVNLVSICATCRPCEVVRGGVRILIRYTTPVRKRPKSLIWMTLTARVRGNRNPRTGFGSFARVQKNNFAKLNFLQ